MRIGLLRLIVIGAIYTPSLATPLAAQECLGLPGERVTATLGFEGTDGAVGVSGRLVAHSGRLGIELEGSSLDKFAQDDDRTRTGLRISWESFDSPVKVCGFGGAQWTSYEAGTSISSWTVGGVTHREARISGDYDRIRVPVGVSVGHLFLAEHHVSINPFVHLMMVHDYERMHWVERGLETRSSTGLGGGLGLTARMGRLFVRSELEDAWTEDRALSGQNNHLTFHMHVGLAF